MIVLLTFGEYSDYTVEGLLEFESRETYAAGVAAYKAAGNLFPEEHIEDYSAKWSAFCKAREKWRTGLHDWLVETGVATTPEWSESHDQSVESVYGTEPMGESQ